MYTTKKPLLEASVRQTLLQHGRIKGKNTKPDLKISGAKYCRGTDASGITCL